MFFFLINRSTYSAVREISFFQILVSTQNKKSKVLGFKYHCDIVIDV